jgi:hypothetical protein
VGSLLMHCAAAWAETEAVGSASGATHAYPYEHASLEHMQKEYSCDQASVSDILDLVEPLVEYVKRCV